MKICSEVTGEHPCWSVKISIKLQSNFIENALRYGCSPVSLLHIFSIPFPMTPLEGCFWESNNSGKIFLLQTEKNFLFFFKYHSLDLFPKILPPFSFILRVGTCLKLGYLQQKINILSFFTEKSDDGQGFVGVLKPKINCSHLWFSNMGPVIGRLILYVSYVLDSVDYLITHLIR